MEVAEKGRLKLKIRVVHKPQPKDLKPNTFCGWWDSLLYRYHRTIGYHRWPWPFFCSGQ